MLLLTSVHCRTDAAQFGALDRKAITEANLTVTTAEVPSMIADHAFVTGHIPRATFERVLSPARMKVGIDAMFVQRCWDLIA
jgi:7,8-dihydropterin-6-yl-methyl-4-(beta-D-ribofuranosyl)aminobenzene 5'-phosphate synthase